MDKEQSHSPSEFDAAKSEILQQLATLPPDLVRDKIINAYLQRLHRGLIGEIAGSVYTSWWDLLARQLPRVATVIGGATLFVSLTAISVGWLAPQSSTSDWISIGGAFIGVLLGSAVSAHTYRRINW